MTWFAMESLDECLQSSVKYEDELIIFWTSGIALVLVGFFGLIGNILNVIVLCLPKFRTHVFTQLLITLTIFDIIFIISHAINIGYFSMACTKHYNDSISNLASIIATFGLSGSTFTTVAVSIERYFGICKPFSRCSRKAWIYILPTIAITILFNFPKAFEYSFAVQNGTLISTPKPWVNGTYQERYYGKAQGWVFSIIPFVLLLFINGAIIITIHREKRILQDVSRATQGTKWEATKTLLAIVGVFLMSRILDIVITIGVFIINDEEELESLKENLYFLYPISWLMVMLNSSINFVIYCMTGKEFRSELFSLFMLN